MKYIIPKEYLLTNIYVTKCITEYSYGLYNTPVNALFLLIIVININFEIDHTSLEDVIICLLQHCSQMETSTLQIQISIFLYVDVLLIKLIVCICFLSKANTCAYLFTIQVLIYYCYVATQKRNDFKFVYIGYTKLRK